jgi:hypothetical protein
LFKENTVDREIEAVDSGKINKVFEKGSFNNLLAIFVK